jgi:aminomethyltransferase
LVESALIDDPAREPPRKTPLEAWHRALGARMVTFSGYQLPLHYAFPAPYSERCRGGVLAEHLHCRAKAALFDVSHMGQAWLSGATAAAALERLVPSDIAGLKPGRQRYTLLTNEAGGIFDDMMVARLSGDRFFLVANASRKAIDFTHIGVSLPPHVSLAEIEDRALLALQGPMAATVLGRLAPEALAVPFLGAAELAVDGTSCLVTRSGYTGEDGFEISLEADRAPALADRLLREEEVVPAGIGARDSLRLEAGLCLYGNDIDELTTPVEAGLAWVIGKRRRQAWDFPGAAAIRDQLENGFPRLRAGIRLDGRAPARAGTEIVADNGTSAGTVTSGGFSPTLNAPIAMGYIRRDLTMAGTSVYLVVRGKPLGASVASLPFVPHRYVR